MHKNIGTIDIKTNDINLTCESLTVNGVKAEGK